MSRTDYRPTKSAAKFFDLSVRDLEMTATRFYLDGEKALPERIQRYWFSQQCAFTHGPIMETGLILTPGEEPFWYDSGLGAGNTAQYLDKVTSNRDPAHMSYHSVETERFLHHLLSRIAKMDNPTELLGLLAPVLEQMDQYFKQHPERVYASGGKQPTVFGSPVQSIGIWHEEYDAFAKADPQGVILPRFTSLKPA